MTVIVSASEFSVISPYFLVLFFSPLTFCSTHTVCKANVPEMITEDYISDVEEGISHLFLLASLCMSVPDLSALISFPCF